MSAVAQLAALYRLAALIEPDPRVRRERVQAWLDAREQASVWSRLGATIACWDLDKTDRARVQRELDMMTIQDRPW